MTKDNELFMFSTMNSPEEPQSPDRGITPKVGTGKSTLVKSLGIAIGSLLMSCAQSFDWPYEKPCEIIDAGNVTSCTVLDDPKGSCPNQRLYECSPVSGDAGAKPDGGVGTYKCCK